MDYSNPNLDFDLESQALIRALKEAEGQRAVRMPMAKLVGGMADFGTGAGGMVDAALTRGIGEFNKPRIEDQQRGLSAEQQRRFEQSLSELTTPGTKEVEGYSYGQGPLRDLSEQPKETVPLSPLEESRRRLGIYGKMSRLPMATQMAQAGIKSEVDFPERQALLDQQQALAREKAARDDELRRLMYEGNLDLRRQGLDLQRQRLEQGTEAARERAGRVTPAEQKRLDAMAEREAAKVRAGSLLDGMESAVDFLDEQGGITNTERSTGSNLISSLRNSAVGQAVGGMVGTKEQAARNDIDSIATALLTELKSLKGLGASQMNSNMELQRYFTLIRGNNKFDADSLRRNIARARELFQATGASQGDGAAPAQPGAAPAPSGGVSQGAKVVSEVQLKDGRTGVLWSDGSRTIK